MLKSILGAASLAALIAFNAPTHAGEYLTNGSFETGGLGGTGSFSGWTLNGDHSFDGVFDGTLFPYAGQSAKDGTYYALVGPVGASAGLSQSFVDIAGEALTISGWVTSDGSSPSNVSFLFNGVTLGASDPIPDQPWTNYTFNVVATGNDMFEVRYQNDATFSGLDDFSVQSVSAVPEPGTWLMLILGFMALGLVRHAGRGRNLQRQIG